MAALSARTATGVSPAPSLFADDFLEKLYLVEPLQEGTSQLVLTRAVGPTMGAGSGRRVSGEGPAHAQHRTRISASTREKQNGPRISAGTVLEKKGVVSL